MGLAACQLARGFGCTVIGTAGTPDGVQLVKQNGAHFTVNHKGEKYLQDIKVNKTVFPLDHPYVFYIRRRERRGSLSSIGWGGNHPSWPVLPGAGPSSHLIFSSRSRGWGLLLACPKASWDRDLTSHEQKNRHEWVQYLRSYVHGW